MKPQKAKRLGKMNFLYNKKNSKNFASGKATFSTKKGVIVPEPIIYHYTK